MSEPAPPSTGPGPLARLAIDLGPLIIFFAVNSWRGIFSATFAFMIAITIAILFSQLKYRHVSPLLWFSFVAVLLLGGITIWLHDETFIKIKPTIYYTTVAALLLFGLATGRNLLKAVLGSAAPGLSERGWQLFTRNYALFFIAMALVNEGVWRTTSTDFWVSFKLWGALPATIIFGFANVPMLMRHGLNSEAATEEAVVTPPE
jgi:intracellular septation protein